MRRACNPTLSIFCPFGIPMPPREQKGKPLSLL
jgi:hypothetical protein